ncbi:MULTISPECIES: Cgl0159 family (beta/alpha)8-fold protein [Streptomycetaceae]|uniref:Cgl0159 family (beta/alpha)8-fold protein n=1 Tax=Embleya scabrispora TaxID=159449 RepID=UPI00037B4961
MDGFLGTPDIVEDLILLGALDGKPVLSSMNRGGIPGASFELDDRFGSYDAWHRRGRHRRRRDVRRGRDRAGAPGAPR